ncbi:MAG: DUF2798 domain-containing protein [Acinetobacter sp.]|nr:DUF2798 domain-containing protein [Acinetobacter sp.]
MSKLAVIPAKYTPIVFSFFMAGIMAFLMSICLVAFNTGLHGNFFERVLHSYIIAMPVAFLCVLLVRPIVMKLVSIFVKMP